MWRNLLNIPFVAEVIEPTTQWKEGLPVYIGMSCYGSDKQKTVAFGIELFYFLGTAERVQREIKAGKKQLVFSDLCFPSDFFSIDKEISLVKKIMEIFSIQNEWEILKVSELLRWKPEINECLSYEDMQSRIAAYLLGENGLQIGWVQSNSAEKKGIKDEKYFFQVLHEKYSHLKGIGAILAKFPMLPGGSSGAPYIVKPHQVNTRLLLIDNPDSIMAKFRRGCSRGRIRNNVFAEVVRFLEYYNLPIRHRDPIKMHVELSEWLAEKIGDEYRKIF